MLIFDKELLKRRKTIGEVQFLNVCALSFSLVIQARHSEVLARNSDKPYLLAQSAEQTPKKGAR